MLCLKSRGHVSAFSYMERQTNNSGPMAKLHMERQAKSTERPCLWIKDKDTKLHITQKLLVGFHPNLHQQTRRILVHLFVYDVIIVETQNEVPQQYPFLPQPISSWLQNSHEIKFLNHVSKFSLASKTNVVSIIVAGHGPLWQVFRWKAPSARTQKVISNEMLYYICKSWYEPFEKYDSRSPGWFKIVNHSISLDMLIEKNIKASFEC